MNNNKTQYDQDITFCNSNCKNQSCHRHMCHIDWNTPKHKYYGCSMRDWSKDCSKRI